jgi:hypothetical protein
MEKRHSNRDWSKHVVTKTETETENFSKVSLEIPGRTMFAVHFINTCGVLLVTGDYGRWSFCREFRPSAGGAVDKEYWIEKLKSGSTQDPISFNPEKTAEELLQRLKDSIWDEYDEDVPENIGKIMECVPYDVCDLLKGYPSDVIEAVEWLVEARETLRNEGHNGYIAYNMRSMPYHVNNDFPEVFTVHPQLLVVFDAFDEICRRMKENEGSTL